MAKKKTKHGYPTEAPGPEFDRHNPLPVWRRANGTLFVHKDEKEVELGVSLETGYLDWHHQFRSMENGVEHWILYPLRPPEDLV